MTLSIRIFFRPLCHVSGRRLSFCLFSCLLLASPTLPAQDMFEVRRAIDTLCSDTFYGRGYYREGDRKAARWIAERFRKAGLLPVGATADAPPGGHVPESFLQPFRHTVNIVENTRLERNRSLALSAGENYLPDAAIPTAKGTARIWRPDPALFGENNAEAIQQLMRTKLEKKMVLIEQPFAGAFYRLPMPAMQKIQQAAGFFLMHEKLTHRVAGYQNGAPIFHLQNSLPAKALQNGKKWSFSAASKLQKDYESFNVAGMVPGTHRPDSVLVLCAHYDHLGCIGPDACFPGANDNAAGVAMLLELARHYVQQPHRYTVLFIAFGAEEAGLIGSRFYTERPLLSLQKTRFVLNLDLIATGQDGMTVVNGAIFKNEFERLLALNQEKGYLPAIFARGKAANSDHYYFSEKGVPAFFFYLMGPWSHYHDPYDRPPVPLTHFEPLFQLCTSFLDGF